MSLSHNLVKYFRDCLSKEGFDQPLTDMFSRSHKDHKSSYGFSRPDNAWPKVGECTLEDLKLDRNTYDGLCYWARRDGREKGPLIMGLFPVVIPDSNGEDIRAPLLVAPLENVLQEHASYPSFAQVPFNFNVLRYNPQVVRALNFDLPELDWSTESNVLEIIESLLDREIGEEIYSVWEHRYFHGENDGTPLPDWYLRPNSWMTKAQERSWASSVFFWVPKNADLELAMQNWNSVYSTCPISYSVPKLPCRWHNYDKLTFETLGYFDFQVDTFASTQLLKGQDYQLMLGLYPIAASIVDDEGKTQRIRAPLLQMPCDLLEGQPAVETLFSDTPISVDALEYNPAVLDLFDDPLPKLDFSSDMGCLDQIEAFLYQRLSEAELNQDNWHSSGIKPTQLRDGKILWGKFPVCWFSRRSRIERSVMHELSLMAESDQPLSPPLLQILGDDQPASHKSTSAPDRLPSPLTRAQESALVNGAEELLSVINGPPGTGKTHTLACQAFDRVVNGESVLIVCANDHAADVVRNKVTALFGGASGLVMRPGRGDYRKVFLEKIEQWLARGEKPSPALSENTVEAPNGHRLKRTNLKLAKALAKAEAADPQLKGILAWFRQWQVGRQDLLSHYWRESVQQLEQHQQDTQSFLIETLRLRLSRLLENHRGELSELTKAARSRTSYHRNRYLDSIDWHLMTRVLPVWIVSAGALNESVPLVKGLFDLVIVDEATQCNLPLALPALQRGRRAVVVGDPQQLRHFSFVSREWQRKMASEHGVNEATVDLDYRNRSLLDYAMSALKRQDSVGFLDEHFRSHPELIAFSNNRYYNNRIKILTHHKSELVEQPFRHIDCGLELEGKLNQAEINSVMSELSRLLEGYSEAETSPSIGIMAMQRRAALELEKRIVEEVPLQDISRFNLRVATPFGFQGEERDIVLMATCLWPGQSESARRFMSRDDVLNVAITRARHQKILFYPTAVLDEPGHSDMKDYLRHARTVEQLRLPDLPEPTDVVRRELRGWLAALGVDSQSDYPFAGQCIDLMVFFGSRRVAIDIVGGAPVSGAELAWEPDRYRLLERAGIQLYPLAAVHWSKRQEDIKQELMDCLGLDGRSADPISLPSLNTDLYLRLLGLPPLLDADDGHEKPLASLYKELSESNNLTGFWIEQHFKPSELSFQRYDASRETLYQAAVAELSGLCLLMESAKDLEGMDFVAPEIQRRYTGCRDAVAALTQLAARLAALRNNTQLEQALADVGRLTERVALYERE